MPYKNKQKKLIPNGLYHAYNRGLLRMDTFFDRQDYKKFLFIIEDQILNKKMAVNIEAFCLMPNHFHLLLRQRDKYDMPKFISIITTEYTRYFNWKYNREGQLWQGTYRAVLIRDEIQYGNVINYIHKNPIDIMEKIDNYHFSSYMHYLGKINFSFIKKGRP